MGKEKQGVKLIANNKKAYHDFFIEEKYEAGIELFGTEIKSLRQGKCSIKESYVGIEGGEAFIFGMHALLQCACPPLANTWVWQPLAPRFSAPASGSLRRLLS